MVLRCSVISVVLFCFAGLDIMFVFFFLEGNRIYTLMTIKYVGMAVVTKITPVSFLAEIIIRNTPPPVQSRRAPAHKRGDHHQQHPSMLR